MRKLIFLFAMLLCLGSFGQSLITPLDDSALGFIKSAIVTLNDDSQIEGVKFPMYMMSNGMISSFTLKTADGEKKKFKADEVKLLEVEPSNFVTNMMIADEITLTNIIKNDYSFIENMKYAIYEKVEIKEEKFRLLQLLNPGFDENIKVYLDPNAKQTSNLGFNSGEDKSFYIKKGDESFLLKKKNYKKEFPILFGDCTAMIEIFESENIAVKFKDLALHVAAYNEYK